jgi:hypothetical protein
MNNELQKALFKGYADEDDQLEALELIEKLQAEGARLRLALTELSKAASLVSSRGAQTGPQWSKLDIASLLARIALSHGEADQ